MGSSQESESRIQHPSSGLGVQPGQPTRSSLSQKGGWEGLGTEES